LEGGLDLVSGGTDNHLVLVDLRDAAVNGHELEQSLEAAGVTCNKNMVPNDPEPPTVTSGVRLGTPAMTTRGMGPDEMREIGSIVCATARGETDGLRDRVTQLTEAFPLYG
jgi:glycine hydroxymethyltransferase